MHIDADFDEASSDSEWVHRLGQDASGGVLPYADVVEMRMDASLDISALSTAAPIPPAAAPAGAAPAANGSWRPNPPGVNPSLNLDAGGHGWGGRRVPAPRADPALAAWAAEGSRARSTLAAVQQMSSALHEFSSRRGSAPCYE